ncbi:MAG: DUF481 domain-containing protein [Chitinophagaceae bacterium]
MKSITLLTWFILAGISARSQFNDSTFYHVNYTSTGVLNRTNDNNSYVLTNGLKFNVGRKDVTMNLTATWLYGEQQQVLTNNDFSSALDFNLYRTIPHFYYWGLATFDKSYSLKINQRLQAGLGGAYNAIDRKNAFLGFSDGVLFEKSDLQQPTGRDDYQTFRNSFRLRFRWVIRDLLILDGTNYLQNSLSKGDDYIIKAVDNVSVKLTTWFSLTASFNYDKINRTKRESLLMTYGVTFDTYF